MFDLPDWDVQLGCGVIRLCSPDNSEAAFLAKGAKAKLHNISERMGTLIEILTPEGKILASFGQPSKPKASRGDKYCLVEEPDEGKLSRPVL